MSRPLRADARRNRELVLAAAREAFVAEGPAVSLDEIARRAGVGAGTVHRHFPTKEALFEAVIVDRLTGLAETATQLADAPDAGEAFFGFLRRLVDEARHNLALAAALTEVGGKPGEAVHRAGMPLQHALATLLERAQRAGSVRTDIEADDLHAIISGVLAMRRGATAGPGLAIVIDGLRARRPG